jgi:hypothetical protein
MRSINNNFHCRKHRVRLLCSTAYQKILYLSRERERERERACGQREAAYETDGIEAAPTWLLQIWVFYFLFLIYLGFVELSVYVFTFLFYITLGENTF